MKPAIQRILCSLAVLVWGSVLLYFYASGRITHYLAPDFRPLVLAGGLGLMVLGLFNLLTAGHTSDCGCGDETHDHGNSDLHPLVVLVLMIAPVLLSVSWTKDRYSPSALTRKGLYDAPSFTGSPAPSPIALGQIQSTHRKTADGHYQLDLMELFFATGVREHQSQIEGQKVETEGRWLNGKADSKAGPRTRLYRMFITCCAADSRAIPILLDFEGAPPEFHDNTWVKVGGTMRYQLENGVLQPVLQVERANEAGLPGEENLMRKP